MNIHSSKHQDDVEKNARSSYFNLPALDVSVAFPQATPATKFPPCASDYYQSDDLLTSEEQAVRMKVRECMEKEIAPIMVEYWEKAEFPFHVMPKLGALRVAGGTIKKLLELMLVVLLLCWCIPLGNAHYCTVRIRGAEAEIFTFFGSVKHHCLLGFD